MIRFAAVIFFLSAVMQSSAAGGDFDLQDFINREYAAGKRLITLPDGDIYIKNTVTFDESFSFLTIQGGKNTRIIGRESIPFFFFNGGRNIKLANFTVDLDPQPITQGTITEIDGPRCSFRIHDGYPRLEEKFLVMHPQFFDRDSRLYIWNRSPEPVTVRQIRKLSDSEGEIEFNTPFQELKTGDYVALNTRKAETIKIRNLSGNLTFEDLTFYATSGYGIIGRRSDGYIHIRRCRIVRDPRPPQGATEARLMASGADAFNFASCRQGPVIEDCEVEAIGDDTVNLHGEPFPIVRNEGKTVWFCTAWKPMVYPQLILPGDTVRLLAPGSFSIEKTAKVVSLKAADPIEVNIKDFYPAGMPKEVQIFKMELDSGLDAGKGFYLDVPAIQAPNFIIRNNYFHNHRARGIRSQASGGIIDGNRIEHIEAAAVSVGPEYNFWNEGGWVDNVTIRNNIIRDTALGINNQYAYTLGAICTFARVEPGTRPGAWNRRIVIENNEISGSQLAGIALVYTDGAIVRNNRISGVCLSKTAQTGKYFNLTPPVQPIEIQYSRNIELLDNKVE